MSPLQSSFRRASYRGLTLALVAVIASGQFGLSLPLVGIVAGLVWVVWGFAKSRTAHGLESSPLETRISFWFLVVGDFLGLAGGTFFVGFIARERQLVSQHDAHLIWAVLFGVLATLRFVPVVISALRSRDDLDPPPVGQVPHE